MTPTVAMTEPMTQCKTMQTRAMNSTIRIGLSMNSVGRKVVAIHSLRPLTPPTEPIATVQVTKMSVPRGIDSRAPILMQPITGMNINAVMKNVPISSLMPSMSDMPQNTNRMMSQQMHLTSGNLIPPSSLSFSRQTETSMLTLPSGLNMKVKSTAVRMTRMSEGMPIWKNHANQLTPPSAFAMMELIAASAVRKSVMVGTEMANTANFRMRELCSLTPFAMQTSSTMTRMRNVRAKALGMSSAKTMLSTVMAAIMDG